MDDIASVLQKNRWLNCGEVKIWHFPSPVFYFRADFISKNKTNY